MFFLLPKEGFDAGGADGMSAVESECGEEELIACGASALAVSHLNITENSMELSLMMLSIHTYRYAHIVHNILPIII